MKSRYRPRLESSKHTNLCTQQRRLRHLTCIIGRNIDASLVPVTRQTSKCLLLSLYFTIHEVDNLNNILYKSEVIEDTLNPNWREFDSTVFSGNGNHSKVSAIVICIWAARKSNTYRVILKYNVHFSGLVYCREQLRSNDQSYEGNSLLFRMFGGYYSWKSAGSNLQQEELTSQSKLNILTQYFKVPQDQTCMSYKKASLLRAHFTLKAISQTSTQVDQVKQKMQEHLHHNKLRRSKCSSREQLIFKKNLLQKELNQLKEKLLMEQKAVMGQTESINNRRNALNRRKQDLEQYISAMKVCHSSHIERREALVKIRAQLNFRRRQLAAELSYIYPIVELPRTDDNKREHTICDVRLPNSEDFLGEDDTMLSVALGNVGHLVYMMAKFSELPLRYPIQPMGSRSSVFDLVTTYLDKLSNKQREFPLYCKGKDKFQFNYGVFLLNKNIAQLRYYNGLGTPDLRNTLTNLKHLLEAKYGVKIVMKGSQPFNNSSVLSTKRDLPSAVTSSTPMQDKVADDTLSKGFDDTDNWQAKIVPMARPRSAVVTSGLPAVHIKAQPQHQFLSRKKKKFDRSRSEPDGKSLSPDLICVPFEDLVQRTVDGTQSRTMQPAPYNNEINMMNESLIDRGEDCLENHEESYVTVHQSTLQPQNSDVEREPPTRQFSVSDALIIPDPFEREPDDPLSPSTDNLLV